MSPGGVRPKISDFEEFCNARPSSPPKENVMSTRRECANAIRALSIDAIEKAASGHPGAPLGMADMAESLWRHFLKHNPADPHWPDRDRFILSNGHASMLLYAALHLSGYDLPMEQIESFRQLGSITPGHPERGNTPGVEMTTGPLGQGIASAVGIALAEGMLAARYNKPGFKIVDHYTYVFCGEGCLMEGISHEACSLAGTWHLGKLIVLFDANGVSIDGNVSGWFTENVPMRFESYGWQVLGPLDGHDPEALDAAIREARRESRKPSLIICKTHIGYGSPKKDTSASHGAPLGPAAALATREYLGWDYGPFEIPASIYASWDAREKGAREEKRWEETFEEWSREYPGLAVEFKRRMAGELPQTWDDLKKLVLEAATRDMKERATRQASKKCLDLLVPALPQLVGGSADLSGSVGTMTEYSIPLDWATYKGNYIFYGVREFGMGAIMNGLALHGGFIPYAGTFLAFSDQAKNALRLSALMNLRVIWILTHDSIGVGEDGPTHQPVEQIPALRLIPGMNVWRPCDNEETAQAWIAALESANNPSCLVLSRQGLPQYHRDEATLADIARGGYVLREGGKDPALVMMASGSEVHLVMDAAAELEKKGIDARVVSMPCAEIFESQDREWRNRVLPPHIRLRIAVEAASADWWIRYVGLDGVIVGMREFGKSAPGRELFAHYGFTVEKIVEAAENLVRNAS